MKLMKVIKKIVLLLLMLLILAGGYFGMKGYRMYADAIQEMSIHEKVETIQQQENYTLFEALPEEYVHAVVAIEDHRFYQHGAIDLISIVRAIINDIKAGKLVEGGSTITQQLAKNIYFTQERKLERKVAEIFMAYDLEKQLNKNEILELYVNTNYFGNGYYGIGKASKGYYDKEPSELNSYECTMLAGVPNAPSVYAPTVNPDLAEERRQKVVEAMAKYNVNEER